MKESPELNLLAEALSKAQGLIEGAKKDSDNPFFRSKYADLASCWDACRKPLSDNGLSVVQLVEGGPYTITIITRLLHSSGQFIESELTLQPAETPLPSKDGEKNLMWVTPQAVGSATSYARRYALMAIVGIAPEDDDGNQAIQNNRSMVRQAIPTSDKDKKNILDEIEDIRQVKGLTLNQLSVKLKTTVSVEKTLEELGEILTKVKAL